MSTTRYQSRIDALGAPSADGQTLIWPEADRLIGLAEENRRRRETYEFSILDRPAKNWTSPLVAGLVFITGHQPAFFHPGVWAKTVAASVLARRCGGSECFLVVDSDVPHRIAIQWPDDAGPLCRGRSTSALPDTDWRSYEHIAGQPTDCYVSMFAEVPEPWRSSTAAMPAFECGFLHPDQSEPTGSAGYVERWMAGLKAVEQELGVSSPSFVRVSHLFTPQPDAEHHAALAFVAHLLLNAERFATAYNQALAAYRARRGIRGRHHPIPDLLMKDGRVELPFWMIRPDRPRQRLAVSQPASGEVRLWSGDAPAGALSSAALHENPAAALSKALGDWQVRPRALAQTMFARLFACDLFIHGIGGAKYDQITDDIIRSFFGIEPPGYVCVSATLRLPLRRYDVQEPQLTAQRRKVRDLRYNPQRYLPVDRIDATLRDLIAERAAAIQASEQLRRHSPPDRTERRKAFERIHRANAGILQAAPDLREHAGRQIEELANRLTHNRIAASREWFFTLYPKTDLVRLRDTLRTELGVKT